MWRWLIALTAVYAVTSLAAPAWTWVDEDGLRHFSDRPVPGATRIDLPDSQTFSRASVGASRGGRSATEEAPGDTQTTQPYTVFDITSPAHQETLWNIGGNLTMQLDIQPPLQNGHSLNAAVDGQIIEIGARGSQLTIPDMFRGVHTLQAVIVDSSGREVLRSLQITVMVQQTSVLNPNNPNRPNRAN